VIMAGMALLVARCYQIFAIIVVTLLIFKLCACEKDGREREDAAGRKICSWICQDLKNNGAKYTGCLSGCFTYDLCLRKSRSKINASAHHVCYAECKRKCDKLYGKVSSKWSVCISGCDKLSLQLKKFFMNDEDDVKGMEAEESLSDESFTLLPRESKDPARGDKKSTQNFSFTLGGFVKTDVEAKNLVKSSQVDDKKATSEETEKARNISINVRGILGNTSTAHEKLTSLGLHGPSTLGEKENRVVENISLNVQGNISRNGTAVEIITTPVIGEEKLAMSKEGGTDIDKKELPSVTESKVTSPPFIPSVSPEIEKPKTDEKRKKGEGGGKTATIEITPAPKGKKDEGGVKAVTTEVTPAPKEKKGEGGGETVITAVTPAPKEKKGEGGGETVITAVTPAPTVSLGSETDKKAEVKITEEKGKKGKKGKGKKEKAATTGEKEKKKKGKGKKKKGKGEKEKGKGEKEKGKEGEKEKGEKKKGKKKKKGKEEKKAGEL
ncbi:hypothetical protein OTU49_006533, partial [Cherax quadricarinatus]